MCEIGTLGGVLVLGNVEKSETDVMKTSGEMESRNRVVEWNCGIWGWNGIVEFGGEMNCEIGW